MYSILYCRRVTDEIGAGFIDGGGGKDLDARYTGRLKRAIAMDFFNYC